MNFENKSFPWKQFIAKHFYMGGNILFILGILTYSN